MGLLDAILAGRLPDTAVAGDIAVASNDVPPVWEPIAPSTIIRSGYDSSPAEAAVAHDAGETWLTLATWARTTLVITDGGIVDIALKLTVTQETGASTAPRDTVTMRASYTRRDTDADTLSNDDDQVANTAAAAVATWSLYLPAAYEAAPANDTFETRIRRGTGGDVANLFFECRKHATQDRSVKFEAYFGNMVP